MKEKVVVSWSGGKDSTFALYKILQSDQYEVDSLLTTVTEGVNRISIHGVRESLLEKQAESLGIPLRKVYIPEECTNELYQAKMKEQLLKIKGDGVHVMVFGDLFLEDVRAYRELLMATHDLKSVFPLWGMPTDKVMEEFLSLGFKTVTSCIDSEVLSDDFLGRLIDPLFLKELPEKVDPCGENGEFHTFTYAGPILREEVAFTVGQKVDKGRFHYCELVDRV